MRKRQLVAILFAAVAASCGCATRPPVPAAALAPGNATAPARLDIPLIAPLFVAEAMPLELRGDELTPEARASFRKRRAATIAARSKVQPPPYGEIPLICLEGALRDPRGLVFLPVCPLFAPVVMVGAHGGAIVTKHAAASLTEPSLQIPEREAGRIAQTLRANATAAALAERATHVATPVGLEERREPRPRIAVTIKSASIEEIASSPGLVIVAEAQGVSADGVELSPTQHASAYAPLTRWDASDEELRRAIEESLDALARGIAETYTQLPKRPVPRAEERSELAAATEDPVLLLNADGSSASPAPSASLPSPGDRWTYRLTEPRRGQPLTRTHEVTVESVSAGAVIEGANRVQHREGSYLVREGDLVLFSPYLASFDPQLAALSANRVEGEAHSCGRVWMCSVSARVVGEEIVRVPAGEFAAVKVEVQQGWTARSVSAYPNGGRTLLVWYSPQLKRAVKFSSRGTRGAHFKTEFDVELQDYRLN